MAGIGLNPSGCCCGLSCPPLPACPGQSGLCRDLTASYSNIATGGGSIGLKYQGGGLWDSACPGALGNPSGVRVSLDMTVNPPVLRLRSYAAGACPAGAASHDCSITDLTQSTCSPFSFAWPVTSTNCPWARSAGYTQFLVTQ